MTVKVGVTVSRGGAVVSTGIDRAVPVIMLGITIAVIIDIVLLGAMSA